MLDQIITVSAIALRSIPQRLWLSLATVLTIATVVTVLLAFLAMSEGFRRTLAGTGAGDVAIVLRGGASAEINSALDRNQQALIETAPGIAKRDGRPLVSHELYVIVDGRKKSDGAKVNLPLRGLTEEGLVVRPDIHIVQGRMFEPGRNEIVAGRALQKEFSGFDLGDTVRFGGSQWTIVGTFSAAGTVFESELWSDLAGVQSAFNRGSYVQSIRAELISPDAIEDLRAYADNDPRLGVDITSEQAYYAEQSENTSDLILYLGWPLAIAMALGALAGALNTIYASVSARTREIATLRAIGFSGLSAFCGTLAESLLLAVCGGVIGAIITFLVFDGLQASTLGASFSQVVFEFKLSGNLIMQGGLLALAIGITGGLFPALRAARLPITAAFVDR